MADIFDYLKWRGDLSFAEIRPCEVDSVIFAMMSYLDYGKLCGGEEKTLRHATEEYCADGRYDSVNLGLIMPSKQINKMVCDAAATRRFGTARITDFDARTSKEEGYQFCAVTFHLSGRQLVIAFRGTDDSLAGWREDCCLSFLDEIPAQRMAVEYLERIAEKYPEERIYLTGHSKGGNLAAYAAINCSEDVRARIARAFCHDGPGLSYSMVNSEKFRRMQRKLTVLIPQSSYIGIMFEKGEKYSVIKSTGVGVFQHDPYSWTLDGPNFIRLPELSQKGKRNEEQFRAAMRKMSSAEKQDFVETMFSIIDSTGASTLTELTDGKLRKLMTLIKGYSGLDRETRELMITLFLKLFDLKKASNK